MGHFFVVIFRQLYDGHKIPVSLRGVLVESTRPVAMVLVEDLHEDSHVLEPAVHALPIEGDHGVSRVAQDDGLARDVVRFALDAHEGALGVVFKGVDGLVETDEIDGIGEILDEESLDLGGGVEALDERPGPEKRGREGAVGVGERDQHVVVARPDVEVVGGNGEFPAVRGVDVLGGRDVELDVAAVDVLLGVVHADDALHLRPGGGVGAVAADDEVEVEARARVGLRPGSRGGGELAGLVAGAERDARQLVAELQLDVGVRLELVQQAVVEHGAVDGVDALAEEPVVLGLLVAERVVDHAAAHGDDFAQHPLAHGAVDELQSGDPARGDGEVDGAEVTV